MVKGNVIPLIGKAGFALLNGMVKDFIHTGDICPGGNYRRQILQRPLQGIIEPGNHQQEQEEGQNIQTTLHQQNGACKRNRGNPKL